MTSSCFIRPIAESDLPLIRNWRNHPTIRGQMFSQNVITEAEHLAWYRTVSRDEARCQMIIETQDGLLGYVQFIRVKPASIAKWGFYIRPDAPPGSGRILGILALDHAFKNLKLLKICGEVLQTNTKSLAFHRRLGFTDEGIRRRQLPTSGIDQDIVCFSLRADQWQTNRQTEDS